MGIRDLTQRLLPKRAADLLWHGVQRLAYTPDLSAADISVWRAVERYTMTTPERVAALLDAVRYVCANGIPGALVECGVWRGGSMMAVALTLRELGEMDRDLVLFDTFAGMTAPDGRDMDMSGHAAAAVAPAGSLASSEAEVAENLRSTGYPGHRVHLVKGRVEDTLPAQAPEKIALLRLDTDWYESTRHELQHLYPRLSSGGVLFLDDYGYWRGTRQATDEYLETLSPRPLLMRLECPARCGVKP
jgi:O-methyltransferase